jgi:cobalamin synthase
MRQDIRATSSEVPSADPVLSAGAVAQEKIDGWKRKGDAAKRVARLGTATIILASALVPVVLLVSTEWSPFIMGKVAPSILAAIAAVAAVGCSLRARMKVGGSIGDTNTH